MRSFLPILLLIPSLVWSQQPHDRLIIRTLEKAAPVAQPIVKDGVAKRFSIACSTTYPVDTALYTPLPHLPPVSQGVTGTCWSFAATSMLESEILRMTGKEVKLSEMYFVYWEYIERVDAWFDKRGDVYVDEGSESNALVRLIRKYGMVPREAYEGKTDTGGFFDHRALITELQDLLSHTRRSASWHKNQLLADVKALLHRHMGTPPDTFRFEGRLFTPAGFTESLAIKPLDYFSFMSTMSSPWYQKGELVEADNWWHNDDYYNIPPDDFMLIIEQALHKGYTVCICGDVSEPGFDAFNKTGIIPTFDIPAAFIDASARELRFSNHSTTDDHCMHVVGQYRDEEGIRWFLFKDSGAGGFEEPFPGYRFVREDYVKLKMMNLWLYKYGASPVLDRIIK